MAIQSVEQLNETSIGVVFTTVDDMIDYPDLLTLAGWEVTSTQGASVTVVDVTPASSVALVLTVDEAMTRGAEYTTTAIPLSDSDTLIASARMDATLTIVQASSTTMRVSSSQPLLAASSYPVGATTVEDADSYSIDFADTVNIIEPSISGSPTVTPSTVTVPMVGLTTLDYTFGVVPDTIRYDYIDASEAPFTESGGTALVLTEVGRIEVWTEDQSLFSLSLEDSYPSDDMAFYYAWDFWAAASMVPPTGENPQELITFIGSDGSYDIRVALSSQDTGVLTPVVYVYTGSAMTLLHTANIDWTYAGGERSVIEILRNPKGDFFSVFYGNTAIYTGPLSELEATDVPKGTRIDFNGQGLIEAHMYLYSLTAMAGYPLYTERWNPVWGTLYNFTGSATATTAIIKTAKGPLVKSWGDYTPATKTDVTVTVNGLTLPIEDVNPYTGEITLSTPWPHSITVTSATVDYHWIDQPLFGAAKLNTKGLVLNKYERDYRHMDAVISSSPNPSRTGTARTGRFRYGVVLGSGRSSAVSIVQPVSYGKRFKAFQKGYSALLNHAPSLRLNQSPFKHAPSSMRHEIETQALSVEGEATPPTEWVITDDGTVSTDSIDTLTVTDGYYSAPVTLESADFSVRMAWRHANTTTPVSGSVFTGVVAGFKDHRRATIVGDLVVNGVKHMGVLNDETQSTVLEGWDVLYPLTLSIRSSTTAVVTGLSLQARVGDRFQIFSGSQAGVYTLSAIARGLTTTTITTVEAFPANYKLYGNRDVTGYGEVPDNVTVQLTSSIARVVAVKFLDVEKVTTASVENFSRLPTSSVFFGHLTAGTSTWKFVRVALTGPLSEVTTGSLTNTFGGDVLWAEGERSHVSNLATSEASSITAPDTFYTPKAVVDTRLVTNELDSEMRLIMSDGKRDIIMAPIVYSEYDGKRHKVSLGRLIHADMVASTGTLTVTEDLTSLVGSSTSEAWITGTLTPTSDITDAGDRILSVVFRGSALDIAFSFGPTFQHAHISLNTVTGTYNLYSGGGAVELNGPGIGFSATDWNWLRVAVDPAGSFVSYLNENIISSTAASNFGDTLLTHQALSLGTDELGATIDFKSITFSQGWQSDSLYTTYGVRRRSGDETSIDGWELPRTDSTTAANSSLSGPVIQEVDITNSQDLRLRYDPEWGTTLYITTLGPSPFYTGASTSFFDAITEPSAGWINLAPSALPRAAEPSAFGSVSLHGYSRTSSLYYRLSQPTANRLLPDPQRQNMVLNRGHVLTSGEHLRDRTPEVKIAEVISSTVASLRATDYYASRIFRVVDGSTIYTGNDVSLASDGQTITLLPSPSTRVPREWLGATVTVTFALDKPSESYMTDETVQSSRQLNEGVPLYEHIVYTGDSYRILLTANAEQPWVDDDESRVLDLTRATEFVDPDNVHYLAMKQYTVDDGGVTGLLAFPRKDSDLTVGLSGSALYETSESANPAAPSTWIHDSPLYAVLSMGGGGYLGSTVVNGVTITWGTESLGGIMGSSVLLPTEGSAGIFPVYDVTLSEAAVLTDAFVESNFSAVLA